MEMSRSLKLVDSLHQLNDLAHHILRRMENCLHICRYRREKILKWRDLHNEAFLWASRGMDISECWT